MSEPRVVMRQEKRKRKPLPPWGNDLTYRVAGWVGLAFALVSLGDMALALYPLGFGSPEWEVATIGSMVQGLPLVSLGLIGIWVSGGGLGSRRVLATAGVACLVAAFALLSAIALLLTDVPIALRGTQNSAPARLGVVKLVLKTVYLAVIFGILYAVAGVLALRRALGSSVQ